MTHQGGRCQDQKTLWRYQAVNQQTGEVVHLDEEMRGRQRWTTPRIQLFQEGIRKIAEDGVLGKEAWRVLGYFLSVLDWDNWIIVPQAKLVNTLGMVQPQVSRAIRLLVEQHLIVQAGSPYPKSAYRLSSDFAYKGQYNGWKKRQREEQAWRKQVVDV